MFAKEYTPIYRGFDSHLGYYQGKGDYWDHTDLGASGDVSVHSTRGMDPT